MNAETLLQASQGAAEIDFEKNERVSFLFLTKSSIFDKWKLKCAWVGAAGSSGGFDSDASPSVRTEGGARRIPALSGSMLGGRRRRQTGCTRWVPTCC